MKACAQCGKEVPQSDLFMSDKGEICAECNLADETAARGIGFHPILVVALVLGVLPFLFSYRITRAVRHGTELVITSRDYVALIGGGAALLVSIYGLVIGMKSSSGRRINITLGAVALILAVVQVLRGFGII